MNNNKLGYLYEDFKFFYIKDHKKLDFDYHHHDFNKIVILLEGDLTYVVEGKNYVLNPWDILLVGANQIHKPITNPNKPYERIIFWLNPKDKRLLNCFDLSIKNKVNVIRPSMSDVNTIKSILLDMKNCQSSTEFASDLLTESLFIQFMVYLNRLFLSDTYLSNNLIATYDKTIEFVINFIDNNLNQKLTIDDIASSCFVSKYYLMRKFKSTMGISIHNYIINKRIVLAKDLISEGIPLNEVSLKCGFNDYSTFVRAFKKIYNLSPSQYNFKSNSLDFEIYE